jgi:cbb3-type cytochrome c oxidase subunit III
MMAALGGLLCLGARHASGVSAGNSAGGARAAGVEKTSGATQPPVAAGALYRKRCATCHGNDGRAKTIKGKLKGARDLTDAAWQADTTDERIYNSISNGRSGGMPSFKKKLTVAEIEALVVHVRSLKK